MSERTPSRPSGDVPAAGLLRGDIMDCGTTMGLRHVEKVEPKSETVVVTFSDGWSCELPHERTVPLHD